MFGVAYAGCVLAREAINLGTFSLWDINLGAGSGSAPSSADSPTQRPPDRVTGSHSPRHGQADCTFDIQKPTPHSVDYEPITTCQWTMTFTRSDPLVPLLRTGDVYQSISAERLLRYLVGAEEPFECSKPVLEYASNSPIALRFTECRAFTSVEWGSSQPGVFANISPIRVKGLGSADARKALADSLRLTVRLNHATIASITGVPVQQDATTAVFDGPPTDLVVRAQLDDPIGQALAASNDEPALRATLFGVDVWIPVGAALGVLALLVPWLLLAGYARRSRAVVAAPIVRSSCWLVGAALVVGLAFAQANRAQAGVLRAVLLIGVPAVAVATMRSHPGAAVLRWRYKYLLTAAAAFLLGSTALAVAWGDGGVRPASLAVGTAIAVLGLAAGAALLPSSRTAQRQGRHSGIRRSVAVIGLATFCGAVAEAWLDPSVPGSDAVILAVTGLLWAPVVAAGLDAAIGVRGRASLVLAIPLAATLFLRPTVIAEDYSMLLTSASRDDLVVSFSAMQLANLVLVGLTIGLLRRMGRRPTGSTDPLAWGAALALIAVLTCAANPSSVGDLMAVLAAALMLIWLTPGRRGSRGLLLATTSDADHSRWLRMEVRRRLAISSAQDLYREARTKITDKEFDRAGYEQLQSSLDDIAAVDQVAVSSRHGSADIPVEQAALGTSAGNNAWRNGVAAAGYMFALSFPILLYEAWAFYNAHDDSLDTLDGLDLLNVLRHLARWLAYGLVFGYFYPLVRGRSPLTKAASLMVAMLVPELLLVAASSSDPQTAASGGHVWVAAAIRCGQVVAVCLGLGLAWERRLCLLAGLSWGRVRNLRSIRALGAPVTTVIVAVATAAGTALAGAAIAAIIATHPDQNKQDKDQHSQQNGQTQSPPSPAH
jgi:hypothetical protein